MPRRAVLPPWPAKPTDTGPTGRPLCRCGCGLEVLPPRRSWRSDECLDRVRLRCDWSVVTKHVYELDKGLCRICGCHPETLRAAVREALADGHTAALEQAKADGWPRVTRKWYEIDHFIPVSDGGGSEGRRNLRVLCFRCHAVRSREQTRARAEKRRIEKARAKG
jgi:5-methylcytosine-specific restriction endonuclease McrA